MTESMLEQANMLWRRLRHVYGDTYHFCSIMRRDRLKHAADRAWERYLRRRKLLLNQNN